MGLLSTGNTGEMSIDSPPEQQRFARTQTPESPRPVPVQLSEPAKIPVLLNQMDEASNDLATYNIPTDQTFAHYGDSLENPAYKTVSAGGSGNADHDPLTDFLRQADTIVANPADPTNSASSTSNLPQAPYSNFNPHASNNDNSSSSYANSTGLSSLLSQLSSSTVLNSAVAAQRAQPPVMTSTNGDAQNTESKEVQEEEEESNQNGTHLTGEQSEDIQAGQSSSKVESELPAGIDYQSLLENISQSTSNALFDETGSKASVSDAQSSSLPLFSGLPPKPPQSTTQNASALSLDTSQSQQRPISAAPENQAALQSATSDYPYTNAEPSQASDATMNNADPYAAMSIDQTAIPKQQSLPRLSSAELAEMDPADRPWSPKTQSIYDAFLEDERRYVTEGIWDKFPVGSRLFVG